MHSGKPCPDEKIREACEMNLSYASRKENNHAAVPHGSTVYNPHQAETSMQSHSFFLQHRCSDHTPSAFHAADTASSPEILYYVPAAGWYPPAAF